MLNENHCAETSEKVRQVFDMKRQNGEHIGSFAAYGYLKDPCDKNALVIDGEAAAVVRDIFRMFLDGMSKNAIVRDLNSRGILSPSAYKRRRLGLKYQNPRVDPARPSLWCAMSVTSILKNRMYCGDMVQGRYRMKSYKVHIQETVPDVYKRQTMYSSGTKDVDYVLTTREICRLIKSEQILSLIHI